MSLDSSAARASGVFVEASSELGAAASFCGGLLLENNSELSHLNDDPAVVHVSHHTQCITVRREMGHATFNNNGTTTVLILHCTQQCIAA